MACKSIYYEMSTRYCSKNLDQMKGGKNMPGRDTGGPEGQGPGTGRGQG